MSRAKSEAPLTVADIARIRGVNRISAWKWVSAMEKKYGEPLFFRVGVRRHLRIAPDALEKIAEDEKAKLLNPAKVYHEFDRLNRLISEQEQRLNGYAADAADQRRKMKTVLDRMDTFDLEASLRILRTPRGF